MNLKEIEQQVQDSIKEQKMKIYQGSPGFYYVRIYPSGRVTSGVEASYTRWLNDGLTVWSQISSGECLDRECGWEWSEINGVPSEFKELDMNDKYDEYSMEVGITRDNGNLIFLHNNGKFYECDYSSLIEPIGNEDGVEEQLIEFFETSKELK